MDERCHLKNKEDIIFQLSEFIFIVCATDGGVGFLILLKTDITSSVSFTKVIITNSCECGLMVYEIIEVLFQ